MMPAVTVEFRPKGLPNGEDPVADLHAVGIAELGDGQVVVRFNFDHGEIGFLVEADDAAVVLRRIAIEGDLNFGGLVNHVIVGEDETFFVHDHAGAEAAFGVGAIIGRIKETVEEILEGIAEIFRLFAFALGLFNYLRGGDVYDRGAKPFRDSGKGSRERDRIGDDQQRGAASRSLSARGLRVTRNQGADQDADAEREGHEEGGKNLAAAHPAD